MATLTGTELSGREALVVGGTGNVGFYLVEGLIRSGAHVFVPSRTQSKIERLLSRLGSEQAKSVVPLPGDIGSPEGAHSLHERVRALSNDLAAVVAAPASWHQTDSMFGAGFADFRNVIETRLYPHYLAAEAFLPLLAGDGSYTTINGPAGFVAAPQPGVGSISVAAAAQNKLMMAFASETGGEPRVNDVIMTAFFGPNGTRPGSPLTGEQVADFVVSLGSAKGAHLHQKTINLRDPRQVAEALEGRFSGVA